MLSNHLGDFELGATAQKLALFADLVHRDMGMATDLITFEDNIQETLTLDLFTFWSLHIDSPF